MALINCPECGREISEKAISCPGCGFPISNHLENQKRMEIEEQEKNREIDRLKNIYFCKSCNTQNEIGEDYCSFCGNRLTSYSTLRKKETENDLVENKPDEFNGVYRYSLFRGKQEVYCPRCNSTNCSWRIDEKVVPEKTKTRYTVNINPLHPFTFANKKEKVVRKEQSYMQKRIICNDCGYIFN